MPKFYSFLVGCAIGLVAVAGASSLAAPSHDASTAAQQIDALLATDWAQHHLQPNAPASDEIFVRRVYLDVVGRIPTYREAAEFLASNAADKRAALIDKLLASEGYVQHFFSFWADILRVQSRGEAAGSTTGTAYVNFIKDSLRANKPYDQFVRELVSAQGRPWDNGAIGYYKRDRGMPLDNTANTVRIFLGTRIECAQCHNHPFDKWTQLQFYQMAAFTYGVETGYYQTGTVAAARKLVYAKEAALRESVKTAAKTMTPEQERLREHYRFMQEALNYAGNPLATTMIDYRTRKPQLPHDYKYADAAPKSAVEPATMLGDLAQIAPGAATLEGYARWLTSPQNPRFTKVIVNRLWKKLFGAGLIEPVDEILDTTTPSNPALMQYLERHMVSTRYDMKEYLRAVLNTQTYQRSVSTAELEPGVACHFTGPTLRRMSAEQMWDSFVTLMNPTPDLPNQSLSEEAVLRLLGARKMNDALESLTPEEVVQGAELAADQYRDQIDALQEAQQQLAAARAQDDAAQVKELNRKVSELQLKKLKSANDGILVPAVNKLAAKTGKAPARQQVMMLGGDVELNMSKVIIPGYDRPAKTAAQLKAEYAAQLSIAMDEVTYFNIPAQEQPDYLKQRFNKSSTWLRAADIESPAPRGHYLREFGQSDREIIENGNAAASIPQALALMNGELVPQILSRYSQVMLAAHKTAYPDQQVEAVYLTLLSRQPTAAEKAVWAKAQQSGLSSIEDLICALINTQQFIFVR